jgi:hypothetical protein
MSETMIATCWNHRSLLRESGGMGRPRGARYSVSSICSAPSRMRTTRSAAEQPEQPLVLAAGHFDVRDLLERQHVAKKAIDRSMFETVIRRPPLPAPAARRPRRAPGASHSESARRRADDGSGRAAASQASLSAR